MFFPKGGMCGGCKHVVRDCSHLDFSKMPKIKVYKDGSATVRCIEYIKREEIGNEELLLNAEDFG